MLGAGPLTRHAEDLMPFLRAVAGRDGLDMTVRDVELGDPADVSIEGLRVVISDDVTMVPVSLELRNARIAAAKALRRAGADVHRVSLPGIKSVIQPYLNAMRESGGLRDILTADGAQLPGFGRLMADAVRGRSRYTTPLLMTLASENMSRFLPERLERRALAAERDLAEQVAEAIGDGVLLHPPFARVAPQPRAHDRAAVDAGADRAVQPPRAAGDRGPARPQRRRHSTRRPGRRRPRPRPRRDRGSARARAGLRRLGASAAIAEAGSYWTVSVPSMPWSRWLSMLQ